MDNKKIAEALVSMLEDVASKAREDALKGRSNIGSIYKRKRTTMKSLDPVRVQQAIADIKRATATKEGTRRLVNAIMASAKIAASIAL